MAQGILSIDKQYCFLKLLATDDKYLKTARPLIEPKHFTAKELGLACKLIYEYDDKYKKAPKSHFQHLVWDYLEKTNAKEVDVELWKVIIENMEAAEPNADYMLGRIDTFRRRAILREASLKFAELVAEDNFTEAEELMSKALKTTVNTSTIEPITSENNHFLMMDFISKKMEGIPTGYEQLDSKTGGLDGIIVLAGQPASGKSTLALNIANNVARSGTPIVVFDYENEQCKTQAKLLCIAEGLDYKNLNAEYTRKFLRGAKPEQYYAAGNLIYIMEDRRITLDKSEYIIEQIKETHDSDKLIVVIDSLQKAPILAGKESRRDAIDVLLRQMEAVKKSQGVTIIAISEYKRVSGDYPDEPNMTLLKESGDIEYTADLILAFSAPRDFAEGNSRGKESSLYVLKNRYSDFTGKINNALYRLVYPYWRFEEREVDFRDNYVLGDSGNVQPQSNN